MKLKLKKNEIPVLRNCRGDGTSRVTEVYTENGKTKFKRFQWPLRVGAIVVPTKWIRDGMCGGGLHGFAYGNGNHRLMYSRSNYDGRTFKYLVLAVNRNDICNLDGKIKFSKCRILYICTTFRKAKKVIKYLTPKGVTCNSGSVTHWNYTGY